MSTRINRRARSWSFARLSASAIMALSLVLGACARTPPAQTAHQACTCCGKHGPKPGGPMGRGVAPQDILGPKPEVMQDAPFAPPAPMTLSASGIPVHVSPRHALPLVALNVVVRGGAGQDPQGKPGLYHFLTRMMLEGAGGRGGADLAAAFDALGADYGASAYSDYLTFSLVVTKDKLPAALDLLRDVMLKPTLSASDFQRAKGLWIDELKNQGRDPKAVAERIAVEQLYGPEHPYGHLRTGDERASQSITLADVKAAYTRLFVRGNTEVVVVGDVEAADATAHVTKLFGDTKWVEPATATVSPRMYTPPFGKVVVVDRPDAPQAVVSLVAPGVRADDRAFVALPRANAVLGGSFTSRLNQDIREERGLAYGASSRLSFARQGGRFAAGASLFAQKAQEGTKALVEDVYAFAAQGPTEEEAAKSRLLSRSELVETYETVTQTAARLARNVGVGLPVGVDGELAPLRDAASRADLAGLAARLLPKGKAFLVYVGPKAQAEKVLPELAPYGFTSIVALTPQPGRKKP